MKKRTLLILLAVLVLLPLSAGHALELSAGHINPFAENTLTVVCERPGLLTIRVDGRMDAVTDLPVRAGKNEVTWRALSWNGEPLPTGLITLTLELTGDDGTTETAQRQVRIRGARPAVLYALPEHDTYLIGGDPLRVEVGVSAKGNVQMSLTPAAGGDPVWLWGGEIPAGNTEHMIAWDWRRPRAALLPGAYVLRAWTRSCPDWVAEVPLTLTDAETAPDGLFLTGPLLPDDPTDDAAVWAAITAPAVVGIGDEDDKLRLLAEKDTRAEMVGGVYCATAALAVLELGDDGWARVGAWTRSGGEYREGYVRRDRLRVVMPNTRYGAVVDKAGQTMRIYDDGRCIGTVAVSTGLQQDGAMLANSETRAGAFLVGSRWTRFRDDGYTYQYPVRIDGANLIHQVGWRTRHGFPAGLADQLPMLGRRASHGCVRVDPRPGEASGGINAYWIWTHFAHNTKVLVIDDPETRHARMDELGIPY